MADATTMAAPAGATLKPQAIEQNVSDETPEQRKKRLNLSDIPYHTYETEQASIKSAKDADKRKDAPYKYEVNGFTVAEIEGDNLQAADPADANKLWEVTGPDDFEKVFTNKRSAEIFVETHSSAVATMPATFPST